MKHVCKLAAGNKQERYLA